MKLRKNYIPLKEVMKTRLYESLVTEINDKITKKQQNDSEVTALSLVTKQFCEEYVENIIEEIQKELSVGHRINLAGVGVLERTLYSPKYVRNPKTGEKLAFKPKMRLKFKMSEAMDIKLNIGRK